MAGVEQNLTVPLSSMWRHMRTGGVYEVVTSTARLQCSTNSRVERTLGGEDWTVYRSVASGDVYLRLTDEFLDGRFQRLG